MEHVNRSDPFPTFARLSLLLACHQFAAAFLSPSFRLSVGGEMGSELVRLAHNSRRERFLLEQVQCVLTANLGN